MYSQPGARVRNIAANPNVTLNFDGDGRGGDIVVLAGTAQVDSAAPAAGANRAWLEKYAEQIELFGMTLASLRASASRSGSGSRASTDAEALPQLASAAQTLRTRPFCVEERG